MRPFYILSFRGASKLNYEALWRLMADLVTQLRKSGESIPASVMKDLRSAKTMIEIFKVDQSRSENLFRVEEYLNNVESYLIPAAQRRFGVRYAEEWMGKLLEARKSDQLWETRLPNKSPKGLPRDKSWVRIGDIRGVSPERVIRLSEEAGLKYKVQEDGRVVVYGEESKVKIFIKKLARLSRSEC
jgi:hypothetical protein